MNQVSRKIISICFILMFRKMYDHGLKQLDKGKAYFENVLSPLSGLSSGSFDYKGLVFFPNIENRDVFMSLEDPFTEEETKVSHQLRLGRNMRTKNENLLHSCKLYILFGILADGFRIADITRLFILSGVLSFTRYLHIRSLIVNEE